jgi:scyllo-inositol 2-dehydrogenase (NADP+)
MAAIKVLLVKGGMWHPFNSCAAILKRAYEDGGLAACTLAERDTAFDQDLSGYDVVVLYTQGGRLTKRQEKSLCQFVRSGGGLVGFHCASDSYVENADFMKMIGTHFASHAPGTPKFGVEVSDHDHELAEGLRNFDIIDEFYILERKADDLDVFMTAQWQGGPQPMAYTRPYGDGRVFYSANGHDERAFRNPEFQRLAIRGLLWAAAEWVPMSGPIGVGLLGYGSSFSMGKLHAAQMQEAGGFEIVAACDIDPAREKAASEDFPGIMTYPKLDDMLQDDDVKMVVNITPHDVHAELVIAALRSGRHVVCEKPFCLSQKQADAMIAEARKNKRMLTVYQNRRWDHQFLTARRLVEDGAIGQVFETQLDFANYGHPGTWWRSDKRISGGLGFDWGAHIVDWMLHIIPRRVVSVSGYYQKRKWMMCTNEDHVRVIIRFEDGAVANYCNSQLYGAKGNGWTILGTEGGISFPTIFDKEAILTTYTQGVAQTAQVPCDPDDWPAFYRNVSEHLHHDVPLAVRPESSARVIAIIETAEKSSKAKKELPFKDKYFGR